MTSVVNFSEQKESGNYKKIDITTPDGERVLIETEKCFSWGIQKSDRYDSYSMPLVLKGDSETVQTLKNILQKCKDHLPEKEFGKFLYENQERDTVTIYPRLKYCNRDFGTSVFEEGDVEVNPRKYLNVKRNVRAMIHVEGILIGTKDSLTLTLRQLCWSRF